ncbi:MAG: CpsD/CapB family tyrosine-protein kinase [Terracidiphilus sp.]
MSRNFELMQQLEIDSSPAVADTFQPAFVELEKVNGRVERNGWASDEALGLVQRIFLPQTQNSPRMVVFSGVNPGDGCTGISASVAETLAKNGFGPVCIVEANFRSPTLPVLFGTKNQRGLADALLRDGPIRSFAKPLGSDSLWLLSCGAHAQHSANLLSSERIKSRLAELRDEFALVIIDTPALMRYADAIAIGQLADGVVLVLEAAATRREAAQLAVSTLRSAKIPILGAVLNKRTFPIPEPIYKRL